MVTDPVYSRVLLKRNREKRLKLVALPEKKVQPTSRPTVILPKPARVRWRQRNKA